MITVRVLFFGMLADLVEEAEFRLEIEPGNTTADLYGQISANTKLETLESKPNIKVAVNQELADWETELQAGDEIAFLPPVTGG